MNNKQKWNKMARSTRDGIWPIVAMKQIITDEIYIKTYYNNNS